MPESVNTPRYTAMGCALSVFFFFILGAVLTAYVVLTGFVFWIIVNSLIKATGSASIDLYQGIVGALIINGVYWFTHARRP